MKNLAEVVAEKWRLFYEHIDEYADLRANPYYLDLQETEASIRESGFSIDYEYGENFLNVVSVLVKGEFARI